MRSCTDSTTDRPSGWNRSGCSARAEAIRAAAISICTRQRRLEQRPELLDLGLAHPVVALDAGQPAIGSPEPGLRAAGPPAQVVTLVERLVGPLVLDEERAGQRRRPRTPGTASQNQPGTVPRAFTRSAAPATSSSSDVIKRREPGLEPHPAGVAALVEHRAGIGDPLVARRVQRLELLGREHRGHHHADRQQRQEVRVDDRRPLVGGVERDLDRGAVGDDVDRGEDEHDPDASPAGHVTAVVAHRPGWPARRPAAVARRRGRGRPGAAGRACAVRAWGARLASRRMRLLSARL